MASAQATTMPSYAERLKVLRKYFDGFAASDGYDARRLTPSQKASITRKYRQFEAFEREAFAEPGASWLPTRVRDPKAVQKMREAGPGAAVGYPKGLRGWVVVRSPGGAQAVGLTRSGAVQVTGPMGVRMVYESIDPKLMASDPQAAARWMMKRHPKADGFAIRAGQWGWAKRDVELAFDPAMIETMVAKTLYRYGADVPGEKGKRADRERGKVVDLAPRSPASNFYANWVTGMVAFYFPPPPPDLNIGDFAMYVDRIEEERRVLKRREKNRRRSQRERLKGRQG